MKLWSDGRTPSSSVVPILTTTLTLYRGALIGNFRSRYRNAALFE